MEAENTKRINTTLIVNSEAFKVNVAPNQTLLQVLRDMLGFTEVKSGCEGGECGACTVLLNGKPVNSCIILAVQVDGSEITTIKGISPKGELHSIQQKFIEHDAVQCGYCSPGMILTAKALLDDNPAPSENEVRRAISGHICRCTGYQQIVEAIKAAAQEQA